MNTRRQFVLGVFFLAALSTLVFYTLFFTDFTLFEEPVEEVVFFPDADGLREGDPVMVAGVRIGRVGTLDFDLDAPNDRRIRVQLLLDEEIALREDYRISIEETTMLGGHHVAIEPGSFSGQTLVRAQDASLTGVVAQNPLAALGSVGDLVDDNSESVRSILRNLEEAIAKINTGDGPAGRLVNDATLGRDLSEAIANIRATSEELAKTTADINAGRGVLGALVNDDELVASLRATVADVRSVAAGLEAGDGTLGRLLKDPDLGQRVADAVDAIATFAEGLEASEGTLGRLVNDRELADEVSALVSNLRQTSEDLLAVVAHVREGEGTLGQLVMNDELYQEVLTAVGLLTRSLEDYREAAPITALTGVLFSAF